MNNLQESILDAMKVFVKDSTSKLNFPLTLECEVIRCTDENKGEYEVKYLENNFLAYCQYKGYKYNNGDVVYVLIPRGDFSKTKIILGIEKDGLIDSIVPVGSFVEDVKVDGSSVVTNSIANIDNMATKNDINTLQRNFQDGVDAIGSACTRKGSPPASSSLEDTIAAIDAIETGGDYMTRYIYSNGTYNAVDDGVDAYDKVEVHIGDTAPYTVKFFDDDMQTVLKTDANVPYDGSTSCTLLDGTTIGGKYFKGWNPAPVKVHNDMNCYPMRGECIISPTEIQDDWDTICANKGEPYPLGSYHSLVLTNNFSFTHRYYNLDKSAYQDVTHTGNYGITLLMYKVAEGEDNSTSTWLSASLISLGDYTNSWDDSRTLWTPTTDSINKRTDWGDCGPNYVLNEGLLNNLPLCLQESIVEVNKSYVSMNPLQKGMNISKVIKTSNSRIWIPSIPELKTFFCTRIAAGYTDRMCFRGLTNRYTEYVATTDAQATQYFEQLYGDLRGVDYSAVYNPTYNTGSYSSAALRDCSVTDQRIPMQMIFESGYRGNLTSGGYVKGLSAPFGFCL